MTNQPTQLETDLLRQFREIASSDAATRIAELCGMGTTLQVWIETDGTTHVFGFYSWGPAGIGRTPYLAASFGRPGVWDEHPASQANALAFAASQTFADVAVEYGYTRAEGTEQLALAFAAETLVPR